MRAPVFWMALMLLASAVPPASADVVTHGGRYIAGSGELVLWCDDHPHQWLPDLLDSPWIVPHPGQLFSGEPECAPSDLTNMVGETQGNEWDEWGYGGFAWAIPPAARESAIPVWSEDALFGDEAFLRATVATESGQDVSVEACGPVVVPFPTDPQLHWASTPDDPMYLMWAYIPAAGILADLSVCFASAGFAWASWQA